MMLDADVQAAIVVDRSGAVQGIVTVERIIRMMREGEHGETFGIHGAASELEARPRPSSCRPSPTWDPTERAESTVNGQPLIDWDWILRHLDDVVVRTLQHLQLTLIPVALGFAISLLLAVWAVRQPRVYGPNLAVSGLLYTIPSLAAFAFLRAIFGLTRSSRRSSR